MGAALTWVLVTRIEHAEPLVSVLRDLLPLAFGGFVAALVVGLLLGSWWLMRIIGRAAGTLEQIVAEATKAAEAAARRDAPTAVSHAGQAAQEAVGWYAQGAAKRFAVQAALGLFVAFGGLVGTTLLFRQTLLLVEQIRKIDTQMMLLRKQNEKLDAQTGLLSEQNTKIDLQTVTVEAQSGRAGD